jgi:hypothetical protein
MRRVLLLVALCFLPVSLEAQRVCDGGAGDFHCWATGGALLTEGVLALVRK